MWPMHKSNGSGFSESVVHTVSNDGRALKLVD